MTHFAKETSMTITLPASRNCFHPGWLLLLLPPLAAIIVTWGNDNPPELVGHGVRLILAIVAVLPLLGLRSKPTTGRTLRLLKELRTLMPGALVALVVPALLTMRDERETAEFALWAYNFGCLLMGATVFGSEFEQGTIAGLLGQPLTRRGLFLEKLGILGLLLAFALLNLVLCLMTMNSGLQFNLETVLWIVLVPIFALGSGPLFSLLSRSTLAGLIFSVAVPGMLCLGAMLALQLAYRIKHPGVELPEVWFQRVLVIGIPVYLLVSSVLGWLTFRGLEVREGGAGGRGRSQLNPFVRPVDAAFRRLFPVIGGTGQLVRKELLLHVIPWLIASLMVGLWLLWLALRYFTKDEATREIYQLPTLMVFAGLLGAGIIIATGLACVAEERELGTLEWQLTQPASLRRQWWVKLAVAGFLAVMLGVLLPGALLVAGFGSDEFLKDLSTPGVLACVGGFLAIWATSIYASSISRNTMMAAPAAVGIATGLVGIVYLLAIAVGKHIEGKFQSENASEWVEADVMPAWAPSQPMMEFTGFGFAVLSAIILVIGLLELGRRNFCRMAVPAKMVSKQLAGFTVAWLIVLGVFEAGFSQLFDLHLQARLISQHRFLKANALHIIQTRSSAGLLSPATYQEFGVPTNATPEAIFAAVIARNGPDAIYRMGELLTPATNLNAFGMDPAMARRYGLSLAPPPTKSGTNVPPPVTYKMEPALARRYGLVPRLVPPTNAPAGKP
jgi:ABC-type transport system involved in multi-copper enzyme maturation permease subunit